MRGLFPHVFEQSVRGKSQVFRFQHASHLHRAARQVHADGSVMGRVDDRDVASVGSLEHDRRHRQIAGHDDGAHFCPDRQHLNVVAVADEKHDPLRALVPQALGKGIRAHCPDHEQILRGLVRQFARDHFAAKGGHDAGERGADEPRCICLLPRREQVVADLERGEQTEEAAFSVDYRQAAQPPFLEKMNGIINRRVGVDANHVAFHHVAYAVREIADEHWRLDPKPVQHEIDPLVRVPGAGCDHIWGASGTFEVCIGHGRANRIHIRVLVADDDGLHVRWK